MVTQTLEITKGSTISGFIWQRTCNEFLRSCTYEKYYNSFDVFQTHTYIVTPSRDKEPVFEVTGLPENVEAARKEIEAHIAIRTGSTDFGPGSGSGSNGGLNGFFNLNDNGSNGDSANDLFSAPSGGLNSPFSASSGNLEHSILNNETNGFFKSNSGMTLANLLDSSNNFGGEMSR